MGDIQRTHALIARCDVRDYGEPDMPLEDLMDDWARIDLARDAWLAATPAGDLAGYAAVKRWRNEYVAFLARLESLSLRHFRLTGGERVSSSVGEVREPAVAPNLNDVPEAVPA